MFKKITASKAITGIVPLGIEITSKIHSSDNPQCCNRNQVLLRAEQILIVVAITELTQSNLVRGVHCATVQLLKIHNL